VSGRRLRIANRTQLINSAAAGFLGVDRGL